MSQLQKQGGKHTGVTVKHNVVMGSWDVATQSCAKDLGLILGCSP